MLPVPEGTFAALREAERMIMTNAGLERYRRELHQALREEQDRQRRCLVIPQPKEEKQKIPPGVNLAQGRRVGDAQRDKVLARLGELHASGHLDQAEVQARTDAALAAVTQPELDLLLSDVPEPGPSEDAHPVRDPLPLLLCVLMLAIAVPFSVLTNHWGFPVLGILAALLAMREVSRMM